MLRAFEPVKNVLSPSAASAPARIAAKCKFSVRRIGRDLQFSRRRHARRDAVDRVDLLRQTVERRVVVQPVEADGNLCVSEVSGSCCKR